MCRIQSSYSLGTKRVYKCEPYILLIFSTHFSSHFLKLILSQTCTTFRERMEYILWQFARVLSTAGATIEKGGIKTIGWAAVGVLFSVSPRGRFPLASCFLVYNSMLPTFVYIFTFSILYTNSVNFVVVLLDSKFFYVRSF